MWPRFEFAVPARIRDWALQEVAAGRLLPWFAVAYGFGILNVGKIQTVLTSAVIIVVLGLICARLLRQTRPADAGTRPDVQP